MAKVNVTLDDDTVDTIVLAELKASLHGLKNDLKNRKADRGIAVFEMDKEADVIALKQRIKAFKLVLDYYTPPGQ